MTDYQDFTTKDTSIEERGKLNVGDWYTNQVQCLKCKDIIRSKNLHDFRYCSCGAIAVDGGSWYLKRVGKDVLDESTYVELSEKYNNIED